MPTMKRGMEIQVGETAVTIPFSKTAGMRIVAKLEEVYRLFEDLEIERLEDSDSGFTVESFIPIMAIREEVVKWQNGNKSYICTRVINSDLARSHIFLTLSHWFLLVVLPTRILESTEQSSLKSRATRIRNPLLSMLRRW
mmetsp:Transcript_46019/g.74013  ORF Transcript_46019/g.74013 Transcript_46019/m.74013 type:complete len:140 (+) Transcript_46019:472-891(+)